MKLLTELSRRQFLTRATAASAGTVALPYFVPSTALGEDGATPPSERIAMGFVGLGGQGSNLMSHFLRHGDVQVVAVCDVDAGHRENAKKTVETFYSDRKDYKGCAVHSDFRELVARDDLDAVCVATPDHWHALVTIAAVNAGKDVYCEKPLTNSIGEGRAVCEAVKRNQRVLQTGSHERSNPNARFTAELIRNGRLGKLHTIRVNLPCSDGHHKEAQALLDVPPPEPIPDGFDFDFWLGHTPVMPYTSRRCHFWWRFILSYGGGEMTDRGAHIIDLAQLGGGTDDTGPVEIDAKGTRNAASLYDTFWEYQFENVYANGVRMLGSSEGPRGLKFEGDKGWVFVNVHGCRLEAEPASLLAEKIGDDEIQLGRTSSHPRNFLDSVKSRQQPFAPAEVGQRTATICHLTNLGMKLGRKLKWDPVKEQVVGDDEANSLLTPKLRAPWHL